MMRRILITLSALAIVASCIITPAQAQTATPPATPSGTLTPAQKRDKQLSAVYATAAFVKATQMMIEESAVARTKDSDTLKILGAVIAISAVVSETKTALAQPAPLSEFSKPWGELKTQNNALIDLLKRWAVDKSIAATDVLAEMPAIAKRIDTTNAQIITLIAKNKRTDATALQRDYEARIEEMRVSLQDMLK